MSRRTLVERLRRRSSLVAALPVLLLTVCSGSAVQGSALYELLTLPALLLAFVGIIGRLWCTVYIGGRKDSQLVTDGPYSLWRNPLYLFSFVGLCGILLATRLLLLSLILLPPLLLYYAFVIRCEEERLLHFFGEEYRNYRRRVGLVIPALRHYRALPVVEVNLRYYQRAMADTAMFVLALAAAETIHRCKLLGWIDPLIVFPF